jgi:hypothetical protein
MNMETTMDYDLADGPRSRVHVANNERSHFIRINGTRIEAALDENSRRRREKAEMGFGYGRMCDDNHGIDRDTSVE